MTDQARVPAKLQSGNADKNPDACRWCFFMYWKNSDRLPGMDQYCEFTDLLVNEFRFSRPTWCPLKPETGANR